MFGYLMEKEIVSAGSVMENTRRPFTAIVGGAKVSDKVLIVENLLEKADHIISSLPLSMFSLELKESILQNATGFLSDVGQFLQFQYAPFDYKRLKSHFGSVKMSFSMRNFPPAFVYRCML